MAEINSKIPQGPLAEKWRQKLILKYLKARWLRSGQIIKLTRNW